MVEEKKEEKKERWAIGEIPTQTQPVAIDTAEKEIGKAAHSELMLLVKIANDIEKLKKTLD